MKLNTKLAIAGFASALFFAPPAMSAPISVFPKDLVNLLAPDENQPGADENLILQARAGGRGGGGYRGGGYRGGAVRGGAVYRGGAVVRRGAAVVGAGAYYGSGGYYGGGYGANAATCDPRSRWYDPYRCGGQYDGYGAGYYVLKRTGREALTLRVTAVCAAAWSVGACWSGRTHVVATAVPCRRGPEGVRPPRRGGAA